MNSALLLTNAIALTVLLGSHFIPANETVQVAQRTPYYLQLQKAPQLAVMHERHGFVGQEVSQENVLLSADSSERWVF